MFSMYDTLSWRRAYSQSAGTKNVSCIGSIHHRLSSPVFFDACMATTMDGVH